MRATAVFPWATTPTCSIPRFGWVRDGLVWAMALNRAQDRLDLYFIDVKSGKSQLMMTETSDAWIDMHPEVDFMLLRSGDRLPVDQLARWPLPHLSLSLRQEQPANRARQDGAATYAWRLGRREH